MSGDTTFSNNIYVEGRGYSADVGAIAEYVGYRPAKEVRSLADFDSNNGVTIDASGAFNFDGSSYATIARPVSGDFTIMFDFKTTQTAYSTATEWFQGAGLIDGEVTGLANDFGMSIAGGKIMVGAGQLGGTDMTMTSSSTFNDGNWHTFKWRRKQYSGATNFFVDGAWQAYTTHNTNGYYDAAPNLRIGGILTTTTNYFNGQLRNIRFVGSLSAYDSL